MNRRARITLVLVGGSVLCAVGDLVLGINVIGTVSFQVHKFLYMALGAATVLSCRKA